MATDVFLRSGEANPNDVRLRDPTVADGGGVTITADLAAVEAQDVAAFSAVLVHVATLAANDGPGPCPPFCPDTRDTAAFSATLVHTAALAVVESQDVAAFSSVLVHVADLAATEAQDVAAFDANVAGDEQVADTHDGVGGGSALITYKRPHKKVHDEIEEYFDLRTPAEAEKAVDAIAEAASAALGVDQKAREAQADLRHAKASIAALLDEQRNAELRALLALAQDEDDAEAVLVMLELSH